MEHQRREYRRIFVFYPRGATSGGPEALHQLVDAMRRQGADAVLVPVHGTEMASPALSFASYDAPEERTIEDSEDNLVVSYEAQTFPQLLKIRHATVLLWWLSIDFSPVFELDRSRLRTQGIGRLKAELKGVLQTRDRRMLLSRWSRGRVQTWHHAAQSRYAWSYVYNHLNQVSSMLEDYVTLASVDATASAVRNPRAVAFNPAKVPTEWSKIVRSRPDIEWMPIQNLSRSEAASRLRSASVYLDMGHHPGKDRLPREAVLAGAVTVVGLRGAGAFREDVPIPLEHKISFDGDVLANASETLDRVLGDLERARSLQRTYAVWIANEKPRFEEEVTRLLHSRGSVGPWS